MIILAAASGALMTGAWFREKYRREREIRAEKRYHAAVEEELARREDTEAALRERDAAHGAAVHSYRRAVRAMEDASEDFFAHEGLPSALREQGMRHMETLRGLDREYGIGFTKIGSLGRFPAQTHIHAVDMMMRYMQKIAAAQATDFQVNVHGSAPALCGVVPEEHISTLLGDLVENALIAVKTVEEGRVLVDISADVEPFQIDVYDNGQPFPAEVVLRMGRERVTGHAEDGGSGNGLMTALRLCREYGARFELEEFSGGVSFTKRVSLRFDGRGGLAVTSARPEIARALREREETVAK